jgi:hypothetical protein
MKLIYRTYQPYIDVMYKMSEMIPEVSINIEILHWYGVLFAQINRLSFWPSMQIDRADEDIMIPTCRNTTS